MKIISIVLIIFFTSCGYNPIYLNNNLKNFEYKEIISGGNKEITKKIISALNIKTNNNNENKLLISSSFKTDEVSKNSKGQIELYKSTLSVLINVKDSKISNIFFSLGSCDELRGEIAPAAYKDYVLVLLFIKYLSDKYV